MIKHSEEGIKPKQPKTKKNSPIPNNLKNILHELAHDIRNPLGGIRGFAALLEKDLEDRPELQRMASYIIKGTDDLNMLITTILKKVDGE
jgi:nitrogen-specific signal transduction histidine kinase